MADEASTPVVTDSTKAVEEETRPTEAVAEPAVADAEPAEGGGAATSDAAEGKCDYASLGMEMADATVH